MQEGKANTSNPKTFVTIRVYVDAVVHIFVYALGLSRSDGHIARSRLDYTNKGIGLAVMPKVAALSLGIHEGRRRCPLHSE